MNRPNVPFRMLLLAAALAPVAAGAVAPGEQVYSVALHQHGSLSESNGSMEWHADRAQQTGAVDLIWWTDHDWRADHWHHTTSYDFENATVDVAQSLVTEPDDAYTGEFRYWQRTAFASTFGLAVVDTLAIQGAKSLRVSYSHPSQAAAFSGTGIAQTGSRKQNKYSLVVRPQLQLSVFLESLDPVDSRIIVQVTLSEHPGGSHVLRYVAGSLDGEGVDTIALPWQTGQWNTWNFDLLADAQARFTVGGPDTLRAEDNSLEQVAVFVEARNTAQVVAFLDDYRILRDPLDGNAVLGRTRDFGALYETMYPAVSHFIGTEISRYRAQPHLNGYAPNLTLVDYTGRSFSDSLFYAIDQIHAQDGAISLNHVFGTGGYGTAGETEAQKDARLLSKKSELLGVRAWGADVMEIGYRIRHGIDLPRFLDLWDTLTGNAVFVTANGVTDSHGSALFDGWGSWQPGFIHFENNFVTWLFSPTFDEPGLIGAMKAGRAFFGDPFLFDPQGSLDFCTAEGFPMGRTVVTDRAAHDLAVEIDGLPATATVRLLQGEIREEPPVPYLDVNYLRDEIRAGAWAGNVFTDSVTIDTTVPCFVRVEVEDQGVATAYSNPIVFLPAPPAGGVPAPRVAAAVGDVLVRRAADFTLTGISFTPGTPTTRLTVTGDETTPGLGELEIDTGALGAPDGVLGGGFTSTQYANGILTVVGFSGPGSTLDVLWGATGVDAAPDRITRLSLSPGRPNPFGRGTVTEITLPAPAPVFLEVLDVSGRRVRLLLDGPREAGRHRIEWDGRDESGRPVAAGVYFFRLDSRGETATSKAVRIR